MGENMPRFGYGRFLTRLFLVLIITAPAAAFSQTAPNALATVIDWKNGDVQDTLESCGTFIFKNLPDRRATTLWVRGTTVGTCSFSANGLTFHFPSNFGLTTQGTSTLFSFQRIGSDVLVSWIPNY